MIEKITIARKDHVCNICKQPINIGDRYVYGEGRVGKIDEDGEQVGIKFYRYHLHEQPCGIEQLVSDATDSDIF